LSSKSIFTPTPKQQEFIDAVLSGSYKYLLYGGAIRGGKSFVSCAIAILLCKIFPGSRWAIVRKDLTRIKRNLIPTFKKIAPKPFCGEINHTEWTVRCTNGSEIIFFPEGYEDDKDLDRWKGLEVNGFLFEEGNECQQASFEKAKERAGSWVIPELEVQPPIVIMVTCNPSQSWVKEVFYNPWAAGTLKAPYFYLPAKITDNPHVTEQYLESLKELPEQLYRQFVEGDWSVADDPMQIIPYQELRNRLVDEINVDELEGMEALGVDVGELGDDSTVFAHFRGATCYEVSKAEKKRVDEVTAMVSTKIIERKIVPDKVGIDSIGVGAGVWGALVGQNMNVQRIIAGAKAVEETSDDPHAAYKLQFRNLKTQMWWTLRTDIMDKDSNIAILNMPGVVQDLTSVRYKIAGEKLIECEAKDETKKRIGRSPDEGDAVVMANWVRNHSQNAELSFAGISW
jgi:hypothetical protein